jgi:signal transduction histidine kinase
LALFILRASYLLIAGGMIAYFGAFRLRNQTRFAKLAAWPAADLVCDDKLSLGSSLGHAAGVLDSPRLLCVWEYADEAGQHYWRWENGASDASHETEAFPVISPKPEASIFITDRSRGRFALSGSKEKSPIISLPQQIQEKYRFDRVAVAPFSNPTCNGFLFVLDYHDRNNLLALATIAAHRIGAEIEHHWLWRHMQIAAVAQERSRLARNVHDGILQSLTATALNLKICGRHADERTRNEIDAIRAVLAQEQKRVRELIGKVHAQVGKRSFDLATNGRRLVSELEACWHCAIPLRVKPEGAKVSAETAAQLHLILAEAVANAAKHGRAKKVAINLERRAESLDIQIVDNGKGFPGLSGLYDDEALTGLRKRPRSICERVAEIGGHLTLSTSPGGSQLDIRLPI